MSYNKGMAEQAKNQGFFERAGRAYTIFNLGGIAVWSTVAFVAPETAPVMAALIGLNILQIVATEGALSITRKPSPNLKPRPQPA
jgi:hypothetical protein